jgi:hypothetical protein
MQCNYFHIFIRLYKDLHKKFENSNHNNESGQKPYERLIHKVSNHHVHHE